MRTKLNWSHFNVISLISVQFKQNVMRTDEKGHSGRAGNVAEHWLAVTICADSYLNINLSCFAKVLVGKLIRAYIINIIYYQAENRWIEIWSGEPSLSKSSLLFNRQIVKEIIVLSSVVMITGQTVEPLMLLSSLALCFHLFDWPREGGVALPCSKSWRPCRDTQCGVFHPIADSYDW